MQITTITIFCHVDVFLEANHWKDDPQYRLSMAETGNYMIGILHLTHPKQRYDIYNPI